MPKSTTTYLAPEELERQCIIPFVRKHFPSMPESVCPRVTVIQPERALLKPTLERQLPILPAQYSYTYVYQNGAVRQVVYILATADENILRVLTSK